MLSDADAAATLTAVAAAAVAAGPMHFPTPVTRVLVTGGGRHNADADGRAAPPHRVPRSIRSRPWASTATCWRRRPSPISPSRGRCAGLPHLRPRAPPACPAAGRRRSGSAAPDLSPDRRAQPRRPAIAQRIDRQRRPDHARRPSASRPLNGSSNTKTAVRKIIVGAMYCMIAMVDSRSRLAPLA